MESTKLSEELQKKLNEVAEVMCYLNDKVQEALEMVKVESLNPDADKEQLKEIADALQESVSGFEVEEPDD